MSDVGGVLYVAQCMCEVSDATWHPLTSLCRLFNRLLGREEAQRMQWFSEAEIRDCKWVNCVAVNSSDYGASVFFCFFFFFVFVSVFSSSLISSPSVTSVFFLHHHHPFFLILSLLNGVLL